MPGADARRERAGRSELASGISVLERLGILDFNGHMSVRLDDRHLLINSGGSVRSAITASDFVVVTMDGGFDDAAAPPPKELPLHLAVYAARPDVHCVLHGHPNWSTLLSCAGHGYKVTVAQGALLGDVAQFPSPRSINNDVSANEMAAVLGDGRAAMLKAHGSVVVGGDVVETAVLAIYMELNAKRQVRLAAMGADYEFTAEEAAACRKGLNKRGLFEKCWQYYLAKFGLADAGPAI